MLIKENYFCAYIHTAQDKTLPGDSATEGDLGDLWIYFIY